jgi:hypothetical protein
MSTTWLHISENIRARLAWATLGLTVAAWIAAMAIRFTRPVTAAVMDSSQQTVDGAFNAVLLVFAAIGALVAVRQPRNPVGWLLFAMGVLKVIGFLAQEYAIHSLFWRSGVLPGGEVAAWLWNFAYVPLFLALPFILLMFPDGRLPSPRWRWLAVLLSINGLVLTIGAGIANWEQRGRELLTGQFEMPVFLGVSLIVTGFALVASGVSLVLRYSSAAGERRAQLKWLAFSAELIALWIVAEMVRQAAGLEDDLAILLVDALGVVALLSFPVSVGVAVLRDRLYEIDRIINRALVYGVLTLMLAGGYWVSVLVLQSVLPVAGRSPLVIAASTLAIVALFRPLRTRVQSFIDRRFYRTRYDAERTVADFGARLRQEIDLDELGADLVGVVKRTMQPSNVSLWLKTSESAK